MRSSLALAIFFLLLILRGTAALGASYMLTPPRIELSVRPRSVHDAELVVITSPGYARVSFRFYVVDFRMKKDGTIEFAEPGSLERSASSWIKLEPREFQMNPNEKKKIGLKLNVPLNTSGGYYSAIVLDPLPQPNLSKGAALVHTVRMVSLVELKVVGSARLREEAAISDLNIEQSAGTSGLSITTTVENRGNVHIKSKGELLITTKHGGKITTLPLAEGRGLVLPGASRDLSVALNRQLPSGDYVAQAVLKYGIRRKSVAKLAFSISGGKLVATGALVDAGGINFLVDPYLVEITAGGGAFRAVPILVQNDEESPIHVSGQPRGMAFTADGELVTSDPDGMWSCVDWIELQPTEFELMPGRRTRVVARVSIPKAVVGGRCAHIEFKATMVGNGNPKPQDNTAGTVLLLTIPGEELDIAGEITDMRVIQPPKGQTLDFVATFKNKGNVHVMPRGRVVIRPVTGTNRQASVDDASSQGNDVFGEVQFDEIVGAILPGAVRHLIANYPGKLPAGRYSAEVIFRYGGENPATMEHKFTVR